jgi:hypothetical protein
VASVDFMLNARRADALKKANENADLKLKQAGFGGYQNNSQQESASYGSTARSFSANQTQEQSQGFRAFSAVQFGAPVKASAFGHPPTDNEVAAAQPFISRAFTASSDVPAGAIEGDMPGGVLPQDPLSVQRKEITKDDGFDILNHGQVVDELGTDLEIDLISLPKRFDEFFEKTGATHMRGTIIGLGDTWTRESQVTALGMS